jgi:hypothetical protein
MKTRVHIAHANAGSSSSSSANYLKVTNAVDRREGGGS